MIQPLSLLMAMGKLKTFLSPKPLHFLVIDTPAFDLQQLGDFTVAITAVLLRQPNKSQPKAVVIFRRRRLVMLG